MPPLTVFVFLLILHYKAIEQVQAEEDNNKINLIVSKNYRKHIDVNTTERCDVCEEGSGCILSMGLLPEGECMTAFSRLVSSKFIVEDGTGVICRVQYEDYNCVTLDETANSDNGCAERFEPGVCNRGSELFVLPDFCQTTTEPTEEYSVPLVEWHSYERQDWCNYRFPMAPANFFRPNDSGICAPSSVESSVEGTLISGSITQSCMGNRLLITQYSDNSCQEQDMSKLLYANKIRGGCLKDSTFSYYSSTECSVPPQMHCKNLAETEFFTSTAIDVSGESGETDLESFDLYARANWLKIDYPTKTIRCDVCEETDGCLVNFAYLMEGQCINNMNSNTSARYYTVEDGQVCRLYYKDRDCTIEHISANRIQSGCNSLQAPNTCSRDGEYTVLKDFCIRSAVPRSDYIKPMSQYRTYPTMDDCQKKNDEISGLRLAYADPYVCKEAAVITDSGEFIAGSVKTQCRSEDSAFLVNMFSNKECTEQDVSLKYPTYTFSNDNNGCTYDEINDMYRSYDCEAPQFYCKEGMSDFISYMTTEFLDMTVSEDMETDAPSELPSSMPSATPSNKPPEMPSSTSSVETSAACTPQFNMMAFASWGILAVLLFPFL